MDREPISWYTKRDGKGYPSKIHSPAMRVAVRQFRKEWMYMIKNVIFDFGNVLCLFDPDYIACGFVDPDEDPEGYRLFQQVVRRDWEGLDRGTVDYAQYIAESMTLLPASLHASASAFFQDWYKRMPPLPGMEALLRELREEGMGIYLLSNASAYFASKMDEVPILQNFDGRVVSGSIQMMKPEPEIYRYLLDRYGLTAGECLFLDDREENILGAWQCGIHGMVFNGDIEKVRQRLRAELAPIG